MTFAIVGGGQLDTGYTIDNSLRFNDNDSAYLSLATGTATSQTTFTFSSWIKTAVAPSSGQYVFFSSGNLVGAGGTDCYLINLNSSNFQVVTDGAVDVNIITNRVFRDVSSWYHFVVSVDTTQATASDRVKIYVNGELETSFGTASYPSLNYTFDVSSQTALVGSNSFQGSPINFFDGYMAETHLIDGQALSPTDFGEFDEDSGIWKPISYSGTYGTNGFYLDFENSGSLGADQSGNGNNFTPTNLASTDQTTDTPTNNFCTLNPLAKYPNNGILSEGNTTFVGINAGNEYYNTSTFAFAQGKWYSEFKLTADPDGMNIGIMKTDLFGSTSPHNTSSAWTFTRGTKRHNGTSTSYGSTPSTNDILMMAVDMDNGKIWWGLNGTFFNSGDPASGTNEAFSGISGEVYVLVNDDFSIRVPTCLCNFGNPSFSISSGNSDDNGYGNFEYAPPSGYLALCTQNLATELSPTIDDGSEYFNTVLWSGTGSGQSITGMGFQPDWLWFKQRNGTSDHALIDSSRGVNQGLVSNSTAAEVTSGASNDLVSFDSDGFTTGTPQNFGSLGNSGATIVTWGWSANAGSTSSNTDGSITSTVQANTTAGFSIVLYNLNTTGAQTVGHGLSKAPELIINKGRDSTSTWWTFTTVIDGSLDYLPLNGTSAKADDTLLSLPTSTTFGQVENYTLLQNVVSYCFHSVEGYSKIGKYTGNGSTDGTFVYTGFKPAWIMIKRTDASGHNWILLDNKRDSSNVADTVLIPNSSNAEFTETAWDFVSNGFKLRQTATSYNASGGTFIYMAFAENPFVSSTAIPVTAR